MDAQISADAKIRSEHIMGQIWQQDGTRLRLPDFLGIGPPRTGTSWLYRVLRGSAGLPRAKDTQFFRSRYSLGVEWYTAHFAHFPSALPVGEITAAYFAPEYIRERVKLHTPDCRIFCALREPAERMYSHYKDLNRNGMLKGEFAELAFRHADLVDFSRYAYHVRGWHELFGRENVLVLIQEESFSNPQPYINELCNFIGIPPLDLSRIPEAAQRVDPLISAPRSRKMARRMFRLQMQLIDNGRYRTAKFLLPVIRFWKRGGAVYPPLDSGLKQKIRSFLRPEIDGLEELIGRDLSAWQ
jgi:hypothetical protein